MVIFILVVSSVCAYSDIFVPHQPVLDLVCKIVSIVLAAICFGVVLTRSDRTLMLDTLKQFQTLYLLYLYLGLLVFWTLCLVEEGQGIFAIVTWNLLGIYSLVCVIFGDACPGYPPAIRRSILISNTAALAYILYLGYFRDHTSQEICIFFCTTARQQVNNNALSIELFIFKALAQTFRRPHQLNNVSIPIRCIIVPPINSTTPTHVPRAHDADAVIQVHD